MAKKGFGTFKGVFIPSFEAIFGTVLFLVLPMLTGAMGFYNMLLIVVLANSVTFATTFSISDCVTNLRKVGSGGMYALAKRSFGKAFGGSIGIQLYLAQAVSIGFYVIGFAEPLQPLLMKIPMYASWAADAGISVALQKQLLATVLSVIAFIAALVGADFVSKIQLLIFFILIAAVGSIMISPFFEKSVVGKSIFTSAPNLTGAGYAIGFWAAFAAFFPAVTGIDAGVGMSGELKDPRRSLPIGTFLAIFVTLLGYLVVTYVFSLMRPELLLPQADGSVPSLVKIFSSTVPFASYMVLIGILFATGSSALAYFLTAPRTLHTLANDGLLPNFISFLGRDFFKDGREPRWATVLTFLIAVSIIWSGDLTFVSTVVGICFLVVYGWINLAAFLERISGNPSFRPTFKGHWLVSFYGFAFAIGVIALFNIWIGIGVFVSQLILFFLLLRFRAGNKLEGVWWGLIFSVLQWGFKRAKRLIQGTKNWRPIVGVFFFADETSYLKPELEIAERISSFKGLALLNALLPAGKELPELPPEASVLRGSDFSSLIVGASFASLPGGLGVNTVMLPLDRRLNHLDLMDEFSSQGKHVLIYKHGSAFQESPRIDVWWKGKSNGNLMALLAYIIRETDLQLGFEKKEIRLIRMLSDDNQKNEIEKKELESLLELSRLDGSILVLDKDERPFDDIVSEHSSDASLILMGAPGQRGAGLARWFSLDKRGFDKQIEKFENLPPILFVRSAYSVPLFDEY
ncbi:amino acid permease [Spirochaetia bacterium 38H-sp]|uniref:Amino acid permease n=1 Tax=Rarispira pelagica TaxID=3141764 RepID=A0ABU9UDQ3_9SPIR